MKNQQMARNGGRLAGQALAVLAVVAAVGIALAGSLSVRQPGNAIPATVIVRVGQEDGGTTKADEYNPASLGIAAGDTVRWEWFGGTHDVSSFSETSPGVPEWQSGLIKAAGHFFERQFPAPGTYTYYCSIHAAPGDAAPGVIDANIGAGLMVGKVVVIAPATNTLTPTPSPTAPTASPAATATPSPTPAASVSPTGSSTPAVTGSPAPSATAAPSGTPGTTVTPAPTEPTTLTASPTPVATWDPSDDPTAPSTTAPATAVPTPTGTLAPGPGSSPAPTTPSGETAPPATGTPTPRPTVLITADPTASSGPGSLQDQSSTPSVPASGSPTPPVAAAGGGPESFPKTGAISSHGSAMSLLSIITIALATAALLATVSGGFIWIEREGRDHRPR